MWTCIAHHFPGFWGKWKKKKRLMGKELWFTRLIKRSWIITGKPYLWFRTHGVKKLKKTNIILSFLYFFNDRQNSCKYLMRRVWLRFWPIREALQLMLNGNLLWSPSVKVGVAQILVLTPHLVGWKPANTKFANTASIFN